MIKISLMKSPYWYFLPGFLIISSSRPQTISTVYQYIYQIFWTAALPIWRLVHDPFKIKIRLADRSVYRHSSMHTRKQAVGLLEATICLWLILLSNYFDRFSSEWNQNDNNINSNRVRSQKYSNEVEIDSISQKQDMGHRALKTYYQSMSHGRKPVMGELFPLLLNLLLHGLMLGWRRGRGLRCEGGASNCSKTYNQLIVRNKSFPSKFC